MSQRGDNFVHSVKKISITATYFKKQPNEICGQKMELLITEAACAQSAALHRATQNVM
jgi:hypothetical protein